MEQVKVKELASEFEMTDTVVIGELKKIGVWVPSPDTQVDNDIANRIRKRLQFMVEAAEEEKEKKTDKKKAPTAKGRRSIKELGKPRKRAARKATAEVDESESSPFLSTTMKARKGRRSLYRKVEEDLQEEPVQKTEVTIEDEPLIERVEAEVSEELIEQQQQSAEELQAMTRQLQAAEDMRTLREAQEKADAEALAAAAAEAAAAAVLAAEEAAARGETVEVQAEEAAEPEPEVETGPREVVFAEKVTVKLLAEKTGLRSHEIIGQLMKQGVMAGINQVLEQDIIEKLCEQFDIIPDFVSFEEEAVRQDVVEEQPEDLMVRAPVVTVMGHVDHGKTSLLDYLRDSRVTAGEAGGITQHIGAYEVPVGGGKIIFIDTPGHEAFTRMRARGAQATDIVILVVAADDGVMPQTVEAIDHARAADVPIIVAINKIDKPNAQPDRVKQGLSEHKLVPEDWGGDTVFVEVSATEGTNTDQLLEMIQLVAELQELKANPDRAAAGIVLEARMEKGRGNVATVVIENGTMRVGDTFIAGSVYGKVRAMFNDRGKSLKQAGPSSAIELLGLQGLPEAGDQLQVVDNMAKAREIVEFRQEKQREHGLAGSARVSLDDLFAQMAAGDVKDLLVVLKADTQGSAEVLEDTLTNLSTDKVRVRVIRKGVGAISEDDVLLASTSQAIVVGFNIRPEANARSLAEREKVDVRLYSVIYEVADEVQKAMVGLLEPVFEERQIGRAEVRETFKVPKFGMIAGCSVQEGVISRNAEVRLLRDHVVVYEGKIDSLRRFKDDTNEVRQGYECGISIANFNDIKVGDEIEAYVREEVAPTLT